MTPPLSKGIAVLAFSFVALSACASVRAKAAKDPLKCERDPECAQRDERSKDCATQCADNPDCMDRCQQVSGRR